MANYHERVYNVLIANEVPEAQAFSVGFSLNFPRHLESPNEVVMNQRQQDWTVGCLIGMELALRRINNEDFGFVYRILQREPMITEACSNGFSAILELNRSGIVPARLLVLRDLVADAVDGDNSGIEFIREKEAILNDIVESSLGDSEIARDCCLALMRKYNSIDGNWLVHLFKNGHRNEHELIDGMFLLAQRNVVLDWYLSGIISDSTHKSKPVVEKIGFLFPTYYDFSISTSRGPLLHHGLDVLEAMLKKIDPTNETRNSIENDFFASCPTNSLLSKEYFVDDFDDDGYYYGLRSELLGMSEYGTRRFLEALGSWVEPFEGINIQRFGGALGFEQGRLDSLREYLHFVLRDESLTSLDRTIINRLIEYTHLAEIDDFRFILPDDWKTIVNSP